MFPQLATAIWGRDRRSPSGSPIQLVNYFTTYSDGDRQDASRIPRSFQDPSSIPIMSPRDMSGTLSSVNTTQCAPQYTSQYASSAAEVLTVTESTMSSFYVPQAGAAYMFPVESAGNTWPSMPQNFDVAGPFYQLPQSSGGKEDYLYLGTGADISLYNSFLPNITVPGSDKEDLDIHSRVSDPSAGRPPSEQQPTPPSRNPHLHTTHDYQRISPPVNPQEADVYLEKYEKLGAKLYRCKWPNCDKASFSRKCNARAHALSHLERDKPFKCNTCSRQFATEGSARRHRNTQEKKFICKSCHKAYARKDYCSLHERKCIN